jgi:hypothetical protein
MKIENKILKIILNSIPVILMIALIPFLKSDYILTAIYILIITFSFIIKYEKKDFLFLIIGLCIMTICESVFILIGVEVFNRNTLFGLMPLWLPVLWAYAFVVIKRGIIIINK